MTNGTSFADVSFSDSARRVFALAKEHAIRLGHEFVGSEHVLLGLVGSSRGAAARAMDAIGLDRDATRTHVEVLRPPGAAPADRGELPYAESGVTLLRNAIEEARRSKPSRVTTAHILVATVGSSNDIICKVLEAVGVSVPDLVAAARASPQDET